MMLNGMRRSLKRIFATAVGVVMWGGFTFGAPTANSGNDEVTWDHILKTDTIEYKHTPVQQGLTAGKHTIAIQIEMAIDKNGLLLHPYYSPDMTLHRHGASAAKITDETADKLAGVDVEVHYIERPHNLDDWVYDVTNPYTQTLFGNADVITLSMGVPARGDQSKALSHGDIDNVKDVRLADDFWEKTDAIFVWSAGNSGEDSKINMERSEARHSLRADTLLKVGAAFKDIDGAVYLEAYSSRSGASFVASNPYFSGFSYPYFRDEAAVRKRAMDFYDSVPEGLTQTAREVFYERVRSLPDLTAMDIMFGRDLLRKCHPRFNDVSFPGKDALTKDRVWQRANPEKVLDGFVNGLVDSVKYMRWYSGTHENGQNASMNGTSFTAPYAAGVIAAMHEKFPQLSEYDLTAAALIASYPVEKIRNTKGLLADVNYTDNGRGLMHNAYAAGFGYLDPAIYEAVLQDMADMQAADISLSTQEVNTNSGIVFFSNPFDIRRASSEEPADAAEAVDKGTKLPPQYHVYDPRADNGNAVMDGIISGGDFTEYEIQIDDDMIALRTNLEVQFKGGVNVIPETITLVNPQGGMVEVSPTRSSSGQGYSLATTDGHCGNNTKGTWTVRVPKGVELELARLDIVGSQVGGLVDSYLDTYGCDTKPVLSTHGPAVSAPQPSGTDATEESPLESDVGAVSEQTPAEEQDNEQDTVTPAEEKAALPRKFIPRP